ncbi:hypothetical protein [Peribacillus muralis]|uniref:hypothetical protein n=1 Tax=Peribacillus muralis TaxID=264697 RepID=UPI00367213BB
MAFPCTEPYSTIHHPYYPKRSTAKKDTVRTKVSAAKHLFLRNKKTMAEYIYIIFLPHENGFTMELLAAHRMACRFFYDEKKQSFIGFQ